MGDRGLMRRFLSFGSLPLLGSIAPLVILPIIARTVRPDVWAAILTAQAIGAFAGMFILAGWGIFGQARVAAAATEQRRDIYAASLRSRISVAMVVMPVSLIVSRYVIHGAPRGLVVLMLMSTAWTGFTLSWYAVGCGNAAWVIKFEALPDVAANVLAIAAVLATRWVWTYPALFILLSTAGLLVFHVRQFGTVWPRAIHDEDRRLRRERGRAATLSVVGATYASAPLPIASALGVGALPALASADRLFRYAAYTVHTLANTLQEWVLGTQGLERDRRQVLAFKLHLVLGAGGGVSILVLGGWAGRLLFGGAVAPTRPILVGYALAFCFLSGSTPLIRNVLVPSQRTASVLMAVTSSGVVGLASMVLGASALGAAGVALGGAVTETLGFTLLLHESRKASVRPPRPAPVSDEAAVSDKDDLHRLPYPIYLYETGTFE